MKVLLLSRYGYLGASSRIRSYQYLPYLKADGIDVTVSQLLNDDYLRTLYSGKVNYLTMRIGPYLRRIKFLFKSGRFDLLWVESELFPWLPAVGEILLGRFFRMPYIVDYDDALFHSYDRHPNIFVRKLLGHKIDSVMRNAAIVTAGNDYLIARARRSGAKRVEYLPSVIDLERYHVKQNSLNNQFTIGWIGTPSTAKYLEIIRPVLPEWKGRKESRLAITGANSFRTDAFQIEYRPWSKETEISDIQDFDVGIMPLHNTPWEKGKCGYKLIQYMACGKPVIASPVGVNSEIVEHGVNGFLASNKREWIEALDILYNDPEKRYKMGKAGRKKVEERYCLQVTSSKLSNLFHAVTKRM